MHIFEISLFGFQIAPTWYWLMYVFWFTISYYFMKKFVLFRYNDIDDLLFYIFLWVLVGGRIGYIVFYNIDYYIVNPLEIFSVWKWWMSFHGWFLWVILAVFTFSKKRGYSFWKIIDHLAIIIPVALWLWRIGNYINNELPGYADYSGPFAMKIGDISHFPSPLFELFLEWIALFFIMLLVWKIQKWSSYLKNKSSFLSAVFLLWYSSMRLIAEQFRLPDSHIGYLFSTDWITLGMIYTLPMFILWVFLLAKIYKKP